MFYQNCSNDDLGLTSTFCKARSDMGKCLNIRFYGKFGRFWPKIGIYSCLHQDMKIVRWSVVLGLTAL